MSEVRLRSFPAPSGLDLPPPRALFDLLGRVEGISVPWSEFARALTECSRLPADLRELAILRVGARRSCRYVLDAHSRVARYLGIDSNRISSALDLRPGTGQPEQPRDAAVIRAVDQMLDGGRIAQSCRARLVGFVGDDCVLELTMLVGNYVLVSMVCETFGLEPEEGIQERDVAE